MAYPQTLETLAQWVANPQGYYKPSLTSFNEMRMLINKLQASPDVQYPTLAAAVQTALDNAEDALNRAMVPGPAGASGLAGPAGPAGPMGPAGPAGANGASGSSPTHTAINDYQDSGGDLSTLANGGPGASWKVFYTFTQPIPAGGICQLDVTMQVYLDASKQVGVEWDYDGTGGGVLVDGYAPKMRAGGVVGLNRCYFSFVIPNTTQAAIYPRLWFCGVEQSTLAKQVVILKRAATGGLMPNLFKGIIWG
jgi:hypothetical protein